MNLSDLIFKKIKLRCIQEIPTKKHRLIKLNKIPSILNLKKNYETFHINHEFIDLNIPVLLTESGNTEIEIILNFNYFTYREIINVVCNKQMPVSFETIGDIIHFNLNEEYLPYKFLIGRVLNEKTGYTIINKLGNINSQFRYYEFEYIGGKADVFEIIQHSEIVIEETRYITVKVQVKNKIANLVKNESYKFNKDILNLEKEDFNQLKLNDLLDKYSDSSFIIHIDKLDTMLVENRSRFYIDIKNVYWCSKLQDERKRLTQEIHAGEIVCDVFCGLGPMVIPLLLKKCIVYCNDLNNKAIQCLKINIEINKIESEYYIENMDSKIYLENLQKNIKIDHYILNLPKHSLDYLKYIKHGKVHCYFFSTESEVDNLVFKKTGIKNQDIRFIRKVSPNKNVYKLTFCIPCVRL